MTIFNVKKGDSLLTNVFTRSKRDFDRLNVFVFLARVPEQSWLVLFQCQQHFFSCRCNFFLKVESTLRVNKGFIPCDPTNFPLFFMTNLLNPVKKTCRHVDMSFSQTQTFLATCRKQVSSETYLFVMLRQQHFISC